MVGLWPTCNYKPWREGCSLRWLKLASHRISMRSTQRILHHMHGYQRHTTAGMHLFQCDAGELQQSFGQWDSVKVYKTGWDASKQPLSPPVGAIWPAPSSCLPAPQTWINKGCATLKSNSLARQGGDGKQITYFPCFQNWNNATLCYVAICHVSTMMPNLMLRNVGHTCCS